MSGVLRSPHRQQARSFLYQNLSVKNVRGTTCFAPASHSVCVCVVCVCVCVCVCMYIRMYVCNYVLMYVYIYVCVCVCMYIYIRICMCMCMYVYIHTYVCIYVCMYMYSESLRVYLGMIACVHDVLRVRVCVPDMRVCV